MVPDPSVSASGSGAGQARSNGTKPSPQTQKQSESSGSSDPSVSSDRAEGASEQEDQKSSSSMSTEEMKETAELLNKSSNVLNRDLQFTVLPEEDVVQAEIVNRENDEVLQKIPPDELIELRKTIDTFIGMFVDEMR